MAGQSTAVRALTKEATKRNNSLRDFQGVNTQAARQVIGDNQFAWLENIMPVGFGNGVVPPGPSAELATWSGTAYHIRAVNIGGTVYEIVFTTNGAVYAVNLSSYAVITVAVAGTLSGSDSEVCQWENSQAIIVDKTAGYFSWDGATLTKQNGRVQSLTITAIGAGYTSSPTIGFSGGGGSGAAATCHIQVGLVTLTAAGTGYNVGDTVTMAGGTFTTAAQIRVSAVGGGGAIAGINLVTTGDYTVAPANPAASTSPYGTGATFTLNFGIGPITLTSPGSGYTSAPAVAVTSGGGTGGTVTAVLSVVPSGGTSVATYAGRVWVSFNRTIAFSAPDSFSDFSITAGGGSFIMVDETLTSSIITLCSANSFLYVMGESSVNVVADVNVINGSTVFSNTNISASIGTNYQASVLPYYRALWFANPSGVYALYGSTTQKASDDLDGLFPLVTADIEISAGTALIHETLCLCFLCKYDDPNAELRSLLLVFFNKKWFFCSQGDSLTAIDTAIVSGSQVLYATDGTSLRKLFSNTLFELPQKMVTKLWDMGDPLANKQSLKFGLEVLNPNAPQTITGTIDTELTGGSVAVNLVNGNVVDWINDSGVLVEWVNDLGEIVDWINSGYAFMPMDVQTVGRYLGVTLEGTSAGTIYAGLHLQYEMRTPWSEGGAQ